MTMNEPGWCSFGATFRPCTVCLWVRQEQPRIVCRHQPARAAVAARRAGTDAWRQRRRMAGALLLFGCMAGVLCTHALVVSIQEEHEVVQLAQASRGRSSRAVCCCSRDQPPRECGLGGWLVHQPCFATPLLP